MLSQHFLNKRFPEYYCHFDIISPVLWVGNVCTGKVNGQNVQLTLDSINVCDIEGAIPHIALWDGAQYVKQVEWQGEPYRWGHFPHSPLVYVVGACLNAIKQEMDSQPWQYLVSTNPIGVQTVSQILVHTLGRALSLSNQDIHSVLHSYQGRAKKMAPTFTICTEHMQEVIKYYEIGSNIR